VAERRESGVLDTGAHIDLGRLMIAAITSAHELPLYTRDAADFKGLEDLVEIVAV
jgi:predicted nucleic acid-binding protein